MADPRKWTQEEIDAQMLDHDDEIDASTDDDYDPGEECGRWADGRLTNHCVLAGTEWCDWECPYS
jgi:hypothetical protein